MSPGASTPPGGAVRATGEVRAELLSLRGARSLDDDKGGGRRRKKKAAEERWRKREGEVNKESWNKTSMNVNEETIERKIWKLGLSRFLHFRF